MMTNSAKAKVWEASYLPFGGVNTITGSASLNARFPGQWFQLESGLHYNWHRHYDATIARYTQPDPLGLIDGPSVYAYVTNAPQVYTDPDGRNPIAGCLANPACSAGAREIGKRLLDKIGKAAAAAAGAIISAMSDSSEDDEECAEECADKLAQDQDACKAIQAMRGGQKSSRGRQAYARCLSQAMARYANCLRGSSQKPPLFPELGYD